MNDEHNSYGAKIERGVIIHAGEDGYTVESYDRNGLVTPKIKALFGYKYNAGDRVYFILADDGRGKIICALGEQESQSPVSSVNKKTGDVVLSAEDVGALPSNGTAANASKLGNKTWETLKKEMFPVGSVYVMSSNTSPTGLIGGTWERIDKSFPSGSSTASFFKPASGVTVGTCYFSRSGHSISWRLTLSVSSELTDTAFTLGTMDFEALGVTELNCDQYIIGNSDTGNGLSMATIDSETGALIHRERIVNGGGNIAANADIVYKGVIVSNQNRMLNAVCNQFVYRRTE